jgi:hypothetical protein
MHSTNHSRTGCLTEVNLVGVLYLWAKGDWSGTNEGTRAGVCGHGMRQIFNFSLGRYTTAFQAEVYAIKAFYD